MCQGKIVGPLYVSLVLLLACRSAPAEDSWPQFRGPTGQGFAETTGVPLQWSETKNVLWKTPVAGRGWSSPVVLGDQIWMTTAVEEEATPEERAKQLRGNPLARSMAVQSRVTLRAVCLDRLSGKTLHDIKLRTVQNPAPIHSMNSYASPTPVLEPGRLFCHFGTYGTWCLDPSDGSTLWHREIPLQHLVGPGSSPVVVGDLLILVCDGADAQYVVALDKRTGKQVWRTNRPPIRATDGDRRKAFCTPLLIEVDGKQQLVAPGAQWVVAYAPQTGKEIWRADYAPGFSNVPSPVYGSGKVFICTGFSSSELWAIRPEGQGNVTTSHVDWKEKRRIPARPSPLIVDGLLYIIHDSGVATCFQAETGKSVWQHRIGGKHSASPLLIDGKIFFLSHEGVTTVIQPGRKYRPLAENKIDGRIMATPAVVDGAILLRSDTHLYCLKKPTEVSK